MVVSFFPDAKTNLLEHCFYIKESMDNKLGLADLTLRFECLQRTGHQQIVNRGIT